MLRLLFNRPTIASCKPAIHVTSGVRHMNFRADQHEVTSEADLTAVREWLARYKSETIPRNICDISFSRSSGPGGQNVNKYGHGSPKSILLHAEPCRVNSKATLRLPLHSLLPLLPSLLHERVMLSRFYAARSNSLVIQADGSRKQGDNVLECFEKLHDLIHAIGKSVVRGETSLDTKERIKKLYVLSHFFQVMNQCVDWFLRCVDREQRRRVD